MKRRTEMGFGAAAWVGALTLAPIAAVVPLGAQTALSVDGVVESTAGGFRFPDGSVQASGVASGAAPVEDTGQQACWDVAGDPIVCAGTGQDGELQAGVARPTPRFTDQGNGTVTDNLTGLIWLKLADCFGVRSWEDALADAAALMTGSCGLTDGSMATDWRLPNVRELQSLVDFDRDPLFPAVHPFTGLQSSYWSSTSAVAKPERAFSISFGLGSWADLFKADANWVWPVRSGQGARAALASGLIVDAQVAISAAGVIESMAGGFKFPDGTLQATAAGAGFAPVEVTGQEDCWNEAGDSIPCSGTGQDGDARAGVAWPDPRFTDNGDGTVTDHLTGLIWLQLANCFGQRTWADALSDVAAMMNGSCGLSDGSTAKAWRLPNIKELQSLIDFGRSNPALPSLHPFSSVQLDTYWSSTSVIVLPVNVYGVSWDDGGYDPQFKFNSAYVWPVRGGH